MADIRVERRSGISPWVWVVLAIVVLVIAAVLLDYFGYINLPVRLGAAGAGPVINAQFAGEAAASLQEVAHG